MEVSFTPEIESRLEELSAETGVPKEQIVNDAMAGYFEELARVRHELDSRYDQIKSGKLKLIDGEEVFAQLRARSEAWRIGRR